jgi:hypothetical protein
MDPTQEVMIQGRTFSRIRGAKMLEARIARLRLVVGTVVFGGYFSPRPLGAAWVLGSAFLSRLRGRWEMVLAMWLPLVLPFLSVDSAGACDGG